ncbi:MAG TPA: glycosyltransferase family 39 protein, partial [Dongiaceae bacterium]|nr:glycosyltransferase family 39 protein [Dongiaceae bacterium]
LRARCIAARAAAAGPADPGATTLPGSAPGRAVSPGAAEENFLAGQAGWIVLALIVAVGAFLRLDRIDTVPPGLNNDEAINAIETREIVAGKPFRSVTERGLNRETMFHHLAALSYEHPGTLLNLLRAMPGVFGLEPKFINDRLQDEILPLRAVSIVVGTLSIALIGCIGSAWFGRRVGLLAALFLAVSPWHLLYSRVGLRTILSPPFALLAAWLFLKAWREGKWLWPILWGVAVGLGFWTYTSFRVVPIAMAGFVALALLAGRRVATAPAKRRPAADPAPATSGVDRRGLLAGAGVAAAILMLLIAFSGLGFMGFLARGAYATTPPQTAWMTNLFHSVTMLNYAPARYAVIQDDTFISDGVSAAYPLIGLEPDTLLLAAFATLGILLAAVLGFRRRAAAGGDTPAGDAARLLVLTLIAGWLTVGWLGPSLTRMLVLLPFLVLAGALFAARLWESLAGLWRPVTTYVAAAAMIALAGLALAQGYSNLFILAARSERALQHFGAVQTIMGMFARSLPPDEDVVVLHTLRVDTLRYLVGDRPRVTMLTDTTKVSLESVISGPHNVTFVIEYARPFAEPLRGLMMRFPTGDMTQVADARVDPDKPIFYTFTIYKDASGNVVPAPDAATPGMSTGAPSSPPQPPPAPPPGS